MVGFQLTCIIFIFMINTECTKLFETQSSRFNSKESHTPGPGAYNLQKRSDWLKEKNAQKGMPPEMLLAEGMKDGSVSGIS